MNKVIIIGNLTADPVQRTTQSGKTLTAFDIAVTTGKSTPPLYLSCTAWDDPVKTNVLNYLHKGNKVCIVGSLDQPHAYTAKDGNPKGVVKIRVYECEFLPNANKPQGGDVPLPDNIPGQYGNSPQGYQRQQPRQQAQPTQLTPEEKAMGFTAVDPTDDDNGYFNPFGSLPF